MDRNGIAEYCWRVPKADDPPTSAEDHFAANLRLLRDHRGLSQESLAKQMTDRGYKWGQATVYKIEKGERRMQLGEALAVAAILEVPVDKMAAGTGDIVMLSKIRTARAELADLRERLERNARVYEAARYCLLDLATTAGASTKRASEEILAMLTAQERQEIAEAVVVEAATVAQQPPF